MGGSGHRNLCRDVRASLVPAERRRFGYDRNMLDGPNFATIAALLGEPTRARMLGVLMDGRARTATELALDGEVAASTASSHLAQLTTSGLLAVVRQGRHRYFRIATPEVAAVVEGLMGLSSRATPRVSAEQAGLRRARVCYDHLAGEVAVDLLERLRETGLVRGDDEGLEITPLGESWCQHLGIDLAALRRRRRPLCRPCLDWSERRSHLAGALGAALLDRLLDVRHASRTFDSRLVTFSTRGEEFLRRPELGL